MAGKTGNWFSGYRGYSDYLPDSYRWGGSQSEFGFQPGRMDQLGDYGYSLGDLLMQQAMGQGPSVAQQQLRSGLQQAVGGMRGAAAGLPGMGAGLAQRLAGQQAAAMGAQTNAQAGQLRAEEMMQGRNALSQYLLAQLQTRAQGAMGREQLAAQALAEKNRLKMMQDLQNAGMLSIGGFGDVLGGALKVGGGILGSMVGGGYFR